MIFDKHKKKINLFVAQDKDDPSRFLTVTCTKEDAVDFCYKFLRIQKFNHFKLWCDLRKLNVEDESSWDKYYSQCVTIDEKKKFIIRKIRYNFNDVAAIMRMFGGCMPVGCSFDTKTEYDYLNYKLETQKATKTITDTLQDVFSKAKEELEKTAEENTNGK